MHTTRQCYAKGNPIFTMPSSNLYLMTLHDMIAASCERLWSHNSTDMKRQRPKLSSESKLHIPKFNPNHHSPSPYGLCSLPWCTRGGLFIAWVKPQLSRVFPMEPRQLQLYYLSSLWHVLSGLCISEMQFGRCFIWACASQLHLPWQNHNCFCCQPTCLTRQWKQSVIFD